MPFYRSKYHRKHTPVQTSYWNALLRCQVRVTRCKVCNEVIGRECVPSRGEQSELRRVPTRDNQD